MFTGSVVWLKSITISFVLVLLAPDEKFQDYNSVFTVVLLRHTGNDGGVVGEVIYILQLLELYEKSKV